MFTILVTESDPDRTCDATTNNYKFKFREYLPEIENFAKLFMPVYKLHRYTVVEVFDLIKRGRKSLETVSFFKATTQ